MLHQLPICELSTTGKQGIFISVVIFLGTKEYNCTIFPFPHCPNSYGTSKIFMLAPPPLPAALHTTAAAHHPSSCHWPAPLSPLRQTLSGQPPLPSLEAPPQPALTRHPGRPPCATPARVGCWHRPVHPEPLTSPARRVFFCL
jgi:hypothetical protein